MTRYPPAWWHSTEVSAGQANAGALGPTPQQQKHSRGLASGSGPQGCGRCAGLEQGPVQQHPPCCTKPIRAWWALGTAGNPAQRPADHQPGPTDQQQAIHPLVWAGSRDSIRRGWLVAQPAQWGMGAQHQQHGPTMRKPMDGHRRWSAPPVQRLVHPAQVGTHQGQQRAAKQTTCHAPHRHAGARRDGRWWGRGKRQAHFR